MLWVCINFSRCLPSAARLPGGRNRPPYNTRQTAGETGNFAFAADVSFPGTHLRGIVGRAFTPAAKASERRSLPVPCPLCPADLPTGAAFPGRCLASSRKDAGHRNAWGAHQFFPPPSVCRQAPRRAKSPALQYKANGRRNRELCLCGRRFFPRHPFAGDCRAGVHARRESFRTPQPSGSMPALSRRSSNWRGVSGPMLGIVPQSCRSPQCLGCASIFPAAFRLPPCCPAGEIARPTIQGKRQAKPGTECSRQRPFFRHPFVENCRAGVHARRGDFRLPGLPGPMPALPCKVSRNRSVSGPMLGIVPQNCRSPQCFGCASIFPAAFRLPPGSPAGEIARPTIQGKRQAKPGTECSRQRPFSRQPFAGDCRAGVHARRGDFRLPRPSRSNARFALQSFPQSRRFRADENHRPLRKRSGDPQRYCPPPDF